MKDRQELHREPLDKKFDILIACINQLMMDGKGEIVKFEKDPRLLNLFKNNHANMLINFYYSTGTLTITLNYKYFKVELNKKIQFHNMRKADTFRQQDVAAHFVEEAKIAIHKHQEEVGKTMGFTGPSGDLILTPMGPEINPVRKMYSHLSEAEKLELLNMARIIFMSDGSSLKEFKDSAVLRQLLLNLNIDYDTFDKRMALRPSYMDMKQMYSLDLTIQVLSLMPVVLSSNNSYRERRMEALYDLFENRNISRQQINSVIAKMQAFANYFDK